MKNSTTHRRGAALCAVAILALATTACDKNKPPPADGGVTPPSDDGSTPPPPTDRKLAVPADHPLHDRFEGAGSPNDCKADADCHTAGCGSEVCSADAGVVTTCEVLPVSLPAGTACGCVSDQCQWWNAEGATLPPVEPQQPPEEPSASCDTVRCEAPKQCIEYYGIAGPSGPKFVSCEIPCKPGAKTKNSCPAGTTCVTIADGPGSVCR
jgi:eight-cysteine-cluster-containing protein